MGGDPLEQTEANFFEFFGVARLQALFLKILDTSMSDAVHQSYSATVDRDSIEAGSECLAYLDVEVFVNLDRLAEGEDILHNRGQLPHVPYPL